MNSLPEKRVGRKSFVEKSTWERKTYISQNSLQLSKANQPIRVMTASHVTKSKLLLWLEGTHRRSGRENCTLRVSKDIRPQQDTSRTCTVFFGRISRWLICTVSLKYPGFWMKQLSYCLGLCYFLVQLYSCAYWNGQVGKVRILESDEALIVSLNRVSVLCVAKKLP